MFKKRKLKKFIKRHDWKRLEETPSWYREGGEYQALLWLKAYIERRTAATPKEVFVSILNAWDMDTNFKGSFAITILPWI